MFSSPQYEVVNGQPYDYKSDVWGAGCILYELIMLERCFDGGSFPAVMMKIARGKWGPIPPERASDPVRDLIALERGRPAGVSMISLYS